VPRSSRFIRFARRPWWQALTVLAVLSGCAFLVTASVSSAQWAIGISAAIGLAGLLLNAAGLANGSAQEPEKADPAAEQPGLPRIYFSTADQAIEAVALRVARAARDGDVAVSNGPDSEAEAWHFTIDLPSGSVEAVLTANWRDPESPERVRDPRYYYDWRVVFRLTGTAETDAGEREARCRAAGDALLRRLEDNLGCPALHLDRSSRILRMYRPDRGARDFSDEQVFPDPEHRDAWGPWVVRRQWAKAS
jgi:hypothetical protein